MADSNRTRNMIGLVLMGIVALGLVASAFMKILSTEMSVEMMTQFGHGDHIVLLGIIELLCALALIYPKTRKLGFLLVTAYLGGAMATEWANGPFPQAGMVMMIFLWIGMYLRQPDTFGLGKIV